MFSQYKPVVFGLRTGISVDWLKPDAEEHEGAGAKVGLSWGMIADVYFMENYSVLTGFNVQYLHGGMSFPSVMQTVSGGDTLTVSGITDRKYNLQYLQVPVSLKMQAEVADNIALYGKIGIGTAFRLRAKAEDSFKGDDNEVVEKTTDISDEVSFMRESFLIGGGAKFTLKGSTALLVDITYDNGFGNILKGTTTTNPPIEHRGVLNFFELGVGIVF